MKFLHSQLYLRIYLAVLGSLALSALLAALVWHTLYREPPPVFTQLETVARAAAIAIEADATPAQYQQSLTRLHKQLDVGFALYDASGNLVASAVTLPAPLQLTITRQGYVHKRERPVSFVTSVDGGRWLLAQADSPDNPSHLGFLPLLALIAIAVAICAHPIVRRLTIRLERLKVSVDRFGHGDLRSRVMVEGRDEIAAIANSFNLAMTRIEELVNSQRALLANASHELRSPLARLRMSVELAGMESAASQRNEIQQNIVELDQLIDEILLASRLDLNDATGIAKQSVDFTALLAEECARTRAELNAVPVILQGDARLLRRMIRNLLENSARYGGATLTEVALSSNEPQRIRLEVADRGPGIPEQEREKIFAPFYRLPTTSEAQGGVGLGLALVKQIATKHGGAVQCLPRDGGGSLFVVTLPIS